MRRYNGKDYVLDMKNQVIRLNPDFHNELLNNEPGSPKGFKKFGGSSISNVLINDRFKGQFLAFLHMSRLAMPVLEQKYIKAGQVVEDKLFEFLQNKFGPKFSFEHIVASKYQYDYFKGQQKYIGGVPDGLNKTSKIVLEIKSAQEKKLEQWVDKYDLPNEYIMQAQLYAHMLEYPSFIIIAVFLKDSDYVDTEKIDLNNNKVKVYGPYSVDRNKAQDQMDKINEFWLNYARTGVSPIFDPIRDAQVLEYLQCRNEDEWFALFNKWKQRGKIDADIKFEKVK
ncbi:hypothetical protein MCFN_01770 [Mycoplasmopsis californica]|uniref:YqaJ viral recombinase domain-containing protein n=2 Tax=Mycoplasmopsis californica TaxID=2113 RepID=A0A059XR17_9BACT|nr:hypothetical protein [Mycoplasmopsis californica]AIA29495.1 hypothetical protein MCFN_01770 [Mycoplasmopsis californica]